MTADSPATPVSGSGGASIQDKVAFLSCPGTYPANVHEVEVRETHMSWVFLAGERVYKLKKPVKYPFLDFSTLAAREANCREELRLNRRLAPDVYLDIVPLVLDATGNLALQGRGKTVDWLVVMRRLPDDQMLDTAIAQGTVTPARIVKIADVLARFYRHLKPAGISARDYVEHYRREQQKNREILTNKDFDLSKTTLDRILHQIEWILTNEADLLRVRALDGRIVEGHGDLRPEHVCLSEPPVVIDCLEFNRAFRLIDPFDELAFLGVGCEQLGAPWIGSILISHCAGQLGDRPPARLLDFYTAYRACLKARLAIAHLLETDIRDRDAWRPLACDYLAIAERACLKLEPREVR